MVQKAQKQMFSQFQDETRNSLSKDKRFKYISKYIKDIFHSFFKFFLTKLIIMTKKDNKASKLSDTILAYIKVV
jgi:hypothetical protein